MSLTSTPAPASIETGRTPGRRDTIDTRRRVRYVAAAFAAMFVLSVVRLITDVGDVTSIGTFEASLRLAVPIGLAGLGGLYSERAGIVNIGLEGMMILGTWFGAWAGWQYGPWWGVLIGVLGGAAGGLLHAIATVTFNVNHIVSGVAINILGAGVARFLSSIAFTAETGGGITQSPIISESIGHFSLPILAGGSPLGWQSPDVLLWLQRKHWFFVSDVAALLHAVTGNVSWLTIIAFALVPFTYWLLWRTRFGLRLRSVGEHPAAAESLGVPVYRMKYAGVVISGAVSGFAGAYLVLVFSGAYKEGQTGGRGFIGLAAMIFGNWRPAGVAAGAGLFGFADALQLRSDAAIHALLLVVAIALGAMAMLALYQKRYVRAATMAAVGAAFLVWYITSDKVPEQLVSCTPYVVTLIVLATATQRLRMPAADGLPYRKGQAQ
jgi:simple sugar transport system permease protein